MGDSAKQVTVRTCRRYPIPSMSSFWSATGGGANSAHDIFSQHKCVCGPRGQVRDQQTDQGAARQGAGAQPGAAGVSRRVGRGLHRQWQRRPASGYPHGEHATGGLRVRCGPTQGAFRLSLVSQHVHLRYLCLVHDADDLETFRNPDVS